MMNRKKPALKREHATLAAVTAEAYRSSARNEQPWRGSVISPLPAETAYAPFSKKVRESGSPQTDTRVTESYQGARWHLYSVRYPAVCSLKHMMLKIFYC